MAQSLAAQMLVAIAVAFASGAGTAHARELPADVATQKLAIDSVDQSPQEAARRLVGLPSVQLLDDVGQLFQVLQNLREFQEVKNDSPGEKAVLIKGIDLLETVADGVLGYMGGQESWVKEVTTTFLAITGGGIQFETLLAGEESPSIPDVLDVADKLLRSAAVVLQIMDYPVASLSASLGSDVAAMWNQLENWRELFGAPTDQNAKVPAPANSAASSFSRLPRLVRRRSCTMIALVASASSLANTFTSGWKDCVEMGDAAATPQGKKDEDSVNYVTGGVGNLNFGGSAVRSPTRHLPPAPIRSRTANGGIDKDSVERLKAGSDPLHFGEFVNGAGSAVRSPTRLFPHAPDRSRPVNGGIDNEAKEEMANILLGFPKTNEEIKVNLEPLVRVLRVARSDKNLRALFTGASKRLEGRA